MNKTATVSSNEIAVTYAAHPDINREFLTIRCPEGWDDVKKLTNKVLTYEGRKFTFTGWNSDRNDCYFTRVMDGAPRHATIG